MKLILALYISVWVLVMVTMIAGAIIGYQSAFISCDTTIRDNGKLIHIIDTGDIVDRTEGDVQPYNYKCQVVSNR